MSEKQTKLSNGDKMAILEAIRIPGYKKEEIMKQYTSGLPITRRNESLDDRTKMTFKLTISNDDPFSIAKMYFNYVITSRN